MCGAVYLCLTLNNTEAEQVTVLQPEQITDLYQQLLTNSLNLREKNRCIRERKGHTKHVSVVGNGKQVSLINGNVWSFCCLQHWTQKVASQTITKLWNDEIYFYNINLWTDYVSNARQQHPSRTQNGMFRTCCPSTTIFAYHTKR